MGLGQARVEAYRVPARFDRLLEAAQVRVGRAEVDVGLRPARIKTDGALERFDGLRILTRPCVVEAESGERRGVVRPCARVRPRLRRGRGREGQDEENQSDEITGPRRALTT